ncbi:MAG: type 4a pilus biogenesis protein PilO [Candidatus Bipolaricaulia bacterium]
MQIPFLENLATRERALVAIIVLGVILFGLYSFIYTPQQEELQTLDKKLAEKRLARKSLERDNTPEKIQELERQIVDREQELIRLNERIPQREELPLLVRNISTYGEQAGVSITQLKESDFKQGEKFWTKPYTLASEGGYLGMVRMLYAVQRGRRILNVDGFTIVGDDPNNLHVTSVIHSYVIPSEDPILMSTPAQTGPVVDEVDIEPDFELVLQNPFEDYFIPEPEPEIVAEPEEELIVVTLEPDLVLQDNALTFQGLRNDFALQDLATQVIPPALSELADAPPFIPLKQLQLEDRYSYNGFFASDGLTTAIIIKDGREQLVNEGDLMDGYELVEIDHGKVLFKKDGRDYILLKEER